MSGFQKRFGINKIAGIKNGIKNSGHIIYGDTKINNTNSMSKIVKIIPFFLDTLANSIQLVFL